MDFGYIPSKFLQLHAIIHSALHWASQRPVVYTPVQGRPQAVPSLVPGSCSGDQAFAEDTHGGECFPEDTHGGECFAEDIHGEEARFPGPLLREDWEPDKEAPEFPIN